MNQKKYNLYFYNLMKSATHFFYFLFFIFSFIISTTLFSGCAQIGAPTGGAKDTIPPTLIKATPILRATNFTGNKITLEFDEYIDVQDLQKNLIVSPYPKTNPVVDFRLKLVTVKLKDTLLPNTTYTINFGNAIRDNNEGNPFENFSYVFSTGSTIDSLQISGKVFLAESGKVDSTLQVMLYSNADDSSVHKRKPDYLTNLKSDGTFAFANLPPKNFEIYVLQDGDGSKTYNSPTEVFAFLNQGVQAAIFPDSVTLYAYAEEKPLEKKGATPKSIAEKKLRYVTNVAGSTHDLLANVEIDFNNPLKKWDETKIRLTDTSFINIPNVQFIIDSTQRKIQLKSNWKESTPYALIIDKESVSDSTDLKLSKTDTILFVTKRSSDYGTLALKFSSIPEGAHPVLQFVQENKIVKSIPVTSNSWSDKLFPPGEYELRILYDENGNGTWDPGNFYLKKQPEKVITLDSKLNIKANWDTERDIQL
jgi:uncharacterized protein (DUF2141 family)